MKLSDIVIQEAAPADGKPIELQDITKYFPNTYEKAVVALVKSGRLTFGGKQVFDNKGGYGPGLDEAVAAAKALLKGHTENVSLQIEGHVANIDEHSEWTIEDYPLESFEEVYVGYSPRGDKLVIGFDAWLDEEKFNEEWDAEFEKVFSEQFDMDDSDHEKIFSNVHKQFLNFAFMGLAVEVDENGHATMDNMAFPEGFYKLAYKELKARKRLIDFRLD